MSTVREAWSMQCPACDEDGGLSVQVVVTAMAELTPDGTSFDGGDHEWNDSSPCHCMCGWSGTAFDAKKAYADSPATHIEFLRSLADRLQSRFGSDWAVTIGQLRRATAKMIDMEIEIANLKSEAGE